MKVLDILIRKKYKGRIYVFSNKIGLGMYIKYYDKIHMEKKNNIFGYNILKFNKKDLIYYVY